MDDAIPLGHHILTRFEKASVCADPHQRRRLLTVAVVGGGPTGVEFSGALAELVYGPLLRRRVKVRLGVRVEQVEAETIRLAGGETVSTETVVWTAGIQGDPAVKEWGLPVGRAGRVVVDGFLRVEGHPEIRVVGDLAYREDAHGRPLPQVAQVAIQQGRWVGRAIRDELRGRPVRPFRYVDPGMLAVIGRSAAVAHVFGFAFKGMRAWLLWLGLHIAWLIGFRNRALVLVNWAWNYFTFRRAVRL